MAMEALPHMGSTRTMASATAAAPDPLDAERLMRECLRVFAASMRKAARIASDTATDLFEQSDAIDEKDLLDFLVKREEWVHRFVELLTELIERRIGGRKREGRRADPDVSLATLRVLNPRDQELQAGVAIASRDMHRWARREQQALDARMAVLLGEASAHAVDNPFGPDYVLDAIGASARAMFPNPRVWRPFMQRVVTDMTAAVPKAYITLNRLLADRSVLPEAKAALRARSELRPSDDRELLPVFGRLLAEAPSVETIDVRVPPAVAPMIPDVAVVHAGRVSTAVPSSEPGAVAAEEGPVLDLPLPDSSPLFAPETTRAAVAAAASMWSASAPTQAQPVAPAEHDAGGFPSLDPMLALGSSAPLVEILSQWQGFDPEAETTREALRSRGVDPAALPLNRMPYLRIALGPEHVNASEKITMDVISLLFDYIFRDPSIPASSRAIFGRLQVPVLKAAMLDRTFFSDGSHPARRLLERLASGAVGSASSKGYRIAFEGMAARVVDAICNDYGVDIAVFERGYRELATFLEAEQRAVTRDLGSDIEAALTAEANDQHGAHARALVRDRLAGLRLPPEVRMFTESSWADYMALLRRGEGESAPYHAAVQTLDDLLWSITAKERTAQKARLTKMVPRIVAALRKGAAAAGVTEARIKSFLDVLYDLHIAAIKPPRGPSSFQPPPGVISVDGTVDSHELEEGARSIEGVSTEEQRAVEVGGFGGTNNFHDYVSEMAIGTWLAFLAPDGDWINARLTWISPLRTRYFFTSRFRAHTFEFAPEELAWELSATRARVVLEPVPLFDRAVNAALNTLAAFRKPAAA